MTRLLLFGLLVWVFYRLLKAWEPVKKEETRLEGPKVMVECEECKTYIAKAEAVHYKGRLLCRKDCGQ